MSLEVLNSPIFTTLQDRGRFDYVNIGVSPSGVMDEYAYFIAQKLLKNSSSANILEITFSNIEFKAHKNTQIALTGAKCEFYINKEKKSTWQSFNIKAGDIIKVGKIEEGLRVYLSVKDGFKVKKEFASNSTSIKEKLGGLNGDKIKKGDVLDFDEFYGNYTIRLKTKYIPSYNESLELRVVLGYQEEHFPLKQKQKFFSSTYTVSNESNRMACKLNGPAINCDIDGIISEGISFGSIQIPKDGQAIVLLKDRQTIGGYPKLGSVLAIDCFKLSQMKAGTKLSFKEIPLEDAQKELKEFYKNLCC